MKKRVELDVDFIGEQKPLTREEEKALSDFFKRNKTTKAKGGQGKRSRRKKVSG